MLSSPLPLYLDTTSAAGKPMPPGFREAVWTDRGRYHRDGKALTYFDDATFATWDKDRLREAIAPLPPETLYVYGSEHLTDDVTDPAAIAWCQDLGADIMAANGLIRVATYGHYPTLPYGLYLRNGQAADEYAKWLRNEPVDAWRISHAYRWTGAKWQIDGRASARSWQGESGRAALLALQKTHDAAAGMLAGVNCLTPSLYMHYLYNDHNPAMGYHDPVPMIRTYLAECRRLAPGVPIYPFLWCQWHDSTPLVGQTIPLWYWEIVCEAVCRYADGAVIWGYGFGDFREHAAILARVAARAALLPPPA